MKKIVLFFMFFFISNVTFSQVGGEDEVYLNGDYIDAKFEEGGLEKFQLYVFQNFDVKSVERAGQLVCEFTINENGEVKNIKILRDLGINSAMELIRVLRKSPNWQPALRGGKPVSITIKMPLNFK